MRVMEMKRRWNQDDGQRERVHSRMVDGRSGAVWR
jgi:hypothetical protein